MFRRHILHTMRHYNSTFNVLFDYCNYTTELFFVSRLRFFLSLCIFFLHFALTLVGAPTSQTNKSYSLSILITPYLEKHKRRLTCCAYSNSKIANEFAEQIQIDKRTNLNCICAWKSPFGFDYIDKINPPPLIKYNVLYRCNGMCVLYKAFTIRACIILANKSAKYISFQILFQKKLTPHQLKWKHYVQFTCNYWSKKK